MLASRIGQYPRLHNLGDCPPSASSKPRPGSPTRDLGSIGVSTSRNHGRQHGSRQGGADAQPAWSDLQSPLLMREHGQGSKVRRPGQPGLPARRERRCQLWRYQPRGSATLRRSPTRGCSHPPRPLPRNPTRVVAPCIGRYISSLKYAISAERAHRTSRRRMFIAAHSEHCRAT